MQIFYEPDISINGGVLNPVESHHCVVVLRKSDGDRIKVIDGKGNIYTCTITRSHPKKCVVEVDLLETIPASPYKCHVALAPPKNFERFAWFVEKCTEIGVEAIIPLICNKSERRVLNLEKLEKVMVSALKQSANAWKPQLLPLKDFETLLEEPFNGQKFIAHCGLESNSHINNLYQRGENVIILIGPEGDFTPREIEKAIAKGFVPISLGQNRLRTETAGMVSTIAVSLLNG